MATVVNGDGAQTGRRKPAPGVGPGVAGLAAAMQEQHGGCRRVAPRLRRETVARGSREGEVFGPGALAGAMSAWVGWDKRLS
jgi:hypothetical protein